MKIQNTLLHLYLGGRRRKKREKKKEGERNRDREMISQGSITKKGKEAKHEKFRTKPVSVSVGY